MTTAKEHLRVDEFTDEAKGALAAGSDWLLDPDSAQFRPLGRGLETCVNTAELITAFSDFFKIFPRVQRS
jgi:hypothetical protein